MNNCEMYHISKVNDYINYLLEVRRKTTKADKKTEDELSVAAKSSALTLSIMLKPKQRLTKIDWFINDFIDMVVDRLDSEHGYIGFDRAREIFDERTNKLINEIEHHDYEDAYKHFAQQEV